MRAPAWLAAGILTLAASAQAQVVTEMTSERVQEAIALGETGRVKPYWLGSRDEYAPGRAPTALYNTPFLRVALLAQQAHQRGTRLDPDEIPAATLAPEIWVYASAQWVVDPGPARRWEDDWGPDWRLPRSYTPLVTTAFPYALSIDAIVLVPPGAKRAIQPTVSLPREESTHNHETSLIAHFRISDWKDGAAVRVVQGSVPEEAKLRLDKVR